MSATGTTDGVGDAVGVADTVDDAPPEGRGGSVGQIAWDGSGEPEGVGNMVVEIEVVAGSTRMIFVTWAPCDVVKLPSSTTFQMLLGLGSHWLGVRRYAVPEDFWAKTPEKEYAKLM